MTCWASKFRTDLTCPSRSQKKRRVMSKNLSDALKNAKDEIKELIASFFEEIEEDLDELAELVEQNETEQADDLITEIKQKMDNWLAVQ